MGADGTWTMTMKTPMGEQEGTLDLKTDGSTLTGTMSSPQGSMDLENGTVDGDQLDVGFPNRPFGEVPVEQADRQGERLAVQPQLGIF